MSKVDDAKQMFHGCSNLKTIYCNDDWNLRNADTSDMFYGCQLLKGSTFSYDSSKVDGNYARVGGYGYFTKMPIQVYGHEGAYWTTYYNKYVPRRTYATVYVATLSADNSELILQEEPDHIIPAGQAVILKHSNAYLYIYISDFNNSFTLDFSNNSLSGCEWDSPVPDDPNTTIYTMDVKHGQLGFYKFTGQMLGARKAYLAINKSNNAPIRVVFDDATGITTTNSTNFTNSTNEDTQWYDLSGRRLNGIPTAPGLYLNNGHKVIMK